MSERQSYKTKHREELLEYMKSLRGTHITASEVYDHMASGNAKIGKATVYRQLEQMVERGQVLKYVTDPNTPACYEYVPEGDHCQEAVCFHCKCEVCGKLIHMHCEDLDEFQAHLYNHHQFSMDPRRTVFYGICGACAEKGSGR